MCNTAHQLIVNENDVQSTVCTKIAKMAVTALMIPVELLELLQSLHHLLLLLKEYLACAAHIPSACSNQHRQ